MKNKIASNRWPSTDWWNIKKSFMNSLKLTELLTSYKLNAEQTAGLILSVVRACNVLEMRFGSLSGLLLPSPRKDTLELTQLSECKLKTETWPRAFSCRTDKMRVIGLQLSFPNWISVIPLNPQHRVWTWNGTSQPRFTLRLRKSCRT